MTVPAASWRSRRFCAASSRLCCNFCAALIELFPASTSPARSPAFSSSSKRSVWYVRAEGGLGWGLPPPVPGLWAPLKVLALTGRMGCAGGCPAGLRESLLALRRGEGRVEIASGRGAWSPLLFVGVPIGSPRARKTCTDDGGFAVDARTEREHRPRARVSRRRWTEREGAGWRTAPAVGGRGRSRKRPLRKVRKDPRWDEKGRHRDTPRRGYAMNGSVTHPMGRPSSPSPSVLKASSLRNMSTRARRRLGLELLSFDQMKGRELFRWLTDPDDTQSSVMLFPAS